MFFLKKPVVVRAFQFTEERYMLTLKQTSLKSFSEETIRIKEFPNFILSAILNRKIYKFKTKLKDKLAVKTLEGYHIISLNDYLIQGEEKELYPCNPKIFKETYMELL